MNFGSINKIKEAILRRYQVFFPMMLVSSLLLVGYAALDKEAPVIKTDIITVNYGEELDYGKIQIEDNQTSQEDLKVEYDATTLNTNKVGTSYVTVQAEDLSNNIASKIVEVMVVDKVKPTYELVANENAYMENGVLVVNLNASNNITDYIMARDNADGDLSAYIESSSLLDTSTISRQSIALSVSDNSGNVNEKTFDIQIKDIEAPVIEYVYAEAIEIPYGCVFELEKYIKVSDNSGVITTFAPTEPIDTTRDIYTYTIVVRDESDNAIGVPLTIVTKDVSAPKIKVEDRYEITQGTSFDINSKVKVTDDKDGTITPTIEGTVNTNVAGTYKVTIRAEDKAGNKATKNVSVVVKAKPKPVTTTPAKKPTTTTTNKAPAATVNGGGIVGTARSKLGCAYVYGATGPNAFDCSGFTQWVYRQNGKSIPRTTYSQYAAGRKISYSQAQPGDLLFFNTSSTCGHVAIYLGGGMMIHAGTTKTGVCIQSVGSMTSKYPLYGVVRF